MAVVDPNTIWGLYKLVSQGSLIELAEKQCPNPVALVSYHTEYEEAFLEKSLLVCC